MTDVTDVAARRLDLAGTRTFEVAGAGEQRRLRLAEFNREWLDGIWQDATKGQRVDGVALAAVGSVGRADAGPLSDYDLVLLHDGRAPSSEDVSRLADRIWYPIWDAGVRLDHSVRTVGQCRAAAADDLTAAVGLLDISPVAGDTEVVAAARATVSHDWRANARKRLPQLIESMTIRHHRHGELAQSIEPDLKQAHGGLRDMRVLTALAEAWLADRPRGAVDTAYGLLLDVRDAIHVVTGRGRDRLGREDHDAVAALLGHDDPDDLLAEVSDAGRCIAYALDGTLRRAGQSQRARVLRVGPRRPQMVPLGHGLFESDGEVVLGAGRLDHADPHLPLRAAVVAARAELPIAPTTLENLATRCPDLPTPWSPLARSLFGDLLAAGTGLVTVWEGLDQQGIIQRWLPEWGSVRSRPQRNAVHRHTVDRHLVETVVHATGLVRGVGRADLLLLAALLHDIGKVPGSHDHSATGGPIAETVMRRLGHGEDDVAVVASLVREHLTLIELATRRDHCDPRTIDAAVAAVDGDSDRFELLLALTQADAAATGPKAWTDWRAGLLRQLATAVRARLSAPAPAGREVPPAPVPDHVISSLVAGEPHVQVVHHAGSHRIDIADRDRLGLFADTAGLLAAEGLVVRTAILRTLDGIALNEWHVESPTGTDPERDRIARGLMRLATGDHGPLSLLDRRRQLAARPSGSSAIGTHGQPRALVVPGASTDATVLEIRADDRPGILHELGLAFAKAGVSVRSAHIATYAGQTLDTFYVSDLSGRPLEPAKVAQVVAAVIDACDGTT
jgi:[protein-PII] uridylyltransferase